MSRQVDTYIHMKSGKEYPSWEALIEAHANGYLVVAIITSGDGKKTWPYIEGPMPKAEAERVRTNLRSKWKRQQKRMSERDPRKTQTYAFFVRPAWKD